MRKALVFILLSCAAAFAQPAPLTTTGISGPAYNTALNAWLQWLNTNKASTSATLTLNGVTITLGTSNSITTTNITEGTNLYFTNARTLSAMAGLYEAPLTFSAPLARSTNAISLTACADGEIYKYRTATGWTCESDATGEAGSGITTLNTLTGTTQTFSRTNDTNVTLTLTPSGTDHNFALGWSGQLAISRGGTGAASTSQNFAFIGPTSGSGAPSFRALVAGDIPSLAESKITNLVTDLAGKAASNASTTVNGQACALGSTCTVADSTKEPALGNPASDGYVLSSTAAGVRSWVSQGGGHTQNTDTGTTQTTFQIDSGNSGPKLKNNAGVLEARNAADDDYADFRAKTLIAGDGTAPGEAVMNELLVNGTNYISWMVPDSITNTLRLKIPNADPAGSALNCAAPSSNISLCTWLAIAEAATASTIAKRNSSGEVIAANTVATGKTPMATDTALADSQLAAKHKTRSFGFVLGADDGSALVDTNDQASIWSNQLGFGVHITKIWCQTDSGTSTINLMRDDGSAADISASNLTCATGAGANSTSFTSGEDAISDGHHINLKVVSAAASGTPKRITVMVRYTVD